MQKIGSAYNSLSHEHNPKIDGGADQSLTVKVVTVNRLVETYGQSGFKKSDVEGYELEVFRACVHAIPTVCFEANLRQVFDVTEKLSGQLRESKTHYRHSGCTKDPKQARDSESLTNSADAMHVAKSVEDGTIDVCAKLDEASTS